MTRSKALDCALGIVALLLLLLGGLSLRHRPASASHPPTAPQAIAPSASLPPAAKTSDEASAEALSDEATEPKVHRSVCNFRARVMPGETAVMGYYEIAPGKLGASLVTPEALPNGLVSLKVMVVEVPDSPQLRQKAHDLFPHIFELEKTGVISSARRTELLRALLRDDAAKTINYPSMVLSPNTACQIKQLETGPGKEPLGTTYALQADSIPGSEGFDLSVDFQHTGIRE